jgi:hypothetical protein
VWLPISIGIRISKTLEMRLDLMPYLTCPSEGLETVALRRNEEFHLIKRFQQSRLEVGTP